MSTRTQPPPTPPATHHSHRASFSSSWSSLSSFSTASSAASSPPPSPRSSRGGEGTGMAISVPFSWEHQPGIPKTRLAADRDTSPPTPLPLPPLLRAPPSRHRGHHRRRASSTAVDPFATALAECTRERSDAGLMYTLFPAPASSPGPGRRRSISTASGGMAGFLDLYGCKSATPVAEGAFIVRRPVTVARPGPERAGQGCDQGRREFHHDWAPLGT